MLLARLQRQAQRRRARDIHRHADQPPRHVPLEPIARGEEPGMRAAEAHWHAETLRRADHHVGAHLARRRQHCQRQRVGGDDRQRTHGLRRSDLRGQIADRPGAAGILQQQREGFCGADRVGISGCDVQQVKPDRLRPRRQHRARLRMHIRRHRDHVGLRLADRVRHGHRLGRRRRLIQQRRVGDLHPRQVADHGLEVQQRLQPALRDLRLVRRVGGVPAGVFQHVSENHRRRNGAVVAHADQRLVQDVLCRQPTQLGQHARLVDRRRQIERGVAADRSGNGLCRQIRQACRTDLAQHGGDVGLGRCDVARDETVSGFKRCELGQ